MSFALSANMTAGATATNMSSAAVASASSDIAQRVALPDPRVTEMLLMEARKSKLVVEKIEGQSKVLSQVAGQVAYIAESLAESLSSSMEEEEDSEKVVHPEDREAYCDYSACYPVFRSIETELKKRTADEVYVCSDEKGRIEGMMQLRTEEKNLKIVGLASHPKNIYEEKRTLFKGAPLVKGVGRACMRTILQMAQEGRKNVVVDSYNSAVGFYRNYGFRIIKRDTENETTNMALFAADVNTALQKTMKHS